jgi:threonine-phosphate decarboxylase
LGRYFPRKVCHGGASQLHEELNGGGILDFSANLNPFPPVFDWNPDISSASFYPDDSYYKLKKKIANKFGCHEDEICVGNGSIEVIRSFFYAVIENGDLVRTDPHTFGEYALSVKLAGGICSSDSIKKAKVRVICNPNNPTGDLLCLKDLQNIADNIKLSGGMLFVDEAFNELAEGAESMIGKGFSNVFVSRSFTKSFSVPGLRIGFGFGDPSFIEKMEVIRPPWTLNSFAENFAYNALDHYDELLESRSLIKRERNWLYEKFDEIGISYNESCTNFILLDISRNAGDFTRDMLKRGVFIRDCTSFGLPGSVRVAVRTREENEVLVEALKKCWL